MSALSSQQHQVLSRCLAQRSVLLAFSQMIVGEYHLAEDVYQEAVAKAIENADQLLDQESVDAWLRKICRNLAVDVYRKNKRDPLRFHSDVIDLLEEAIPRSIATESWDNRGSALRYCLDELAPKARQLVELRYQRNLSAGDIGSEVGLKKDSVYVTLGRIRAQLRECIGRRLAAVVS